MNKINVKNGIDNIEKYAYLFENKRLGLITGPTGLNKKFKSTIDILNEKFNLKVLYSPEHGVRGNYQAGYHVNTYVDDATGIKVYSLYGENKKPNAEILKDIDVLIIDIQDIGSRYYTYLYTMAYAMQSCAENHKIFVVLDRVDLIGGEKVEGNILDTKFKSFVGLYPIATRYALTMGELAILMNEEFNINCEIKIVKIEGWNRKLYFDETDLIWVNPSPNIPTLDTAILYSGTCLFEGTNISEGRGTTKPFEIIGAPWINPYELSDIMNLKQFDGVVFRPVYFEPTFSKHQGEFCKGVQIHITNKKAIKPINISIHLLYEIINMNKEKFQWISPFKQGMYYFIDYLTGTDKVRLKKYEAEQFCEIWQKESKIFEEIKKKYHIYR